MNILLVTDVPPCINYTAGIVQKQLCKFLFEGGNTVTCVSIVDPLLNPIEPQNIKNKYINYYRYNKPKEGYGRSSALNSLIFNSFHRVISIPNLIKNIIKDLSEKKNIKIDLIWGVIQGQTMIELVRPLAKKLKVPYVVEVWDPPEWWLDENKFDKYSYNIVMRDFGRLIKDAKCCLAASYNMVKEYEIKYNAKAIAVIPSLNEKEIYTKQQREPEKFKIGFSGQIYAKNEFIQFCKALEKMNWKHNNKKIELHVFSDYIDSLHIKSKNLINHGWVNQDKLLEELSLMDLCYCPYRFDNDFKIIARLSFPSKLTTYLKTKVPSFIHAPEYASISNFIEDSYDGYVCNTTDVDEIAQKIENIIDNQNRNNVGINGYKKFKNHLTNNIMRKSFFKALGIEDKNENFTD